MIDSICLEVQGTLAGKATLQFSFLPPSAVGLNS